MHVISSHRGSHSIRPSKVEVLLLICSDSIYLLLCHHIRISFRSSTGIRDWLFRTCFHYERCICRHHYPIRTIRLYGFQTCCRRRRSVVVYAISNQICRHLHRDGKTYRRVLRVGNPCIVVVLVTSELEVIHLEPVIRVCTQRKVTTLMVENSLNHVISWIIGNLHSGITLLTVYTQADHVLLIVHEIVSSIMSRRDMCRENIISTGYVSNCLIKGETTCRCKVGVIFAAAVIAITVANPQFQLITNNPINISQILPTCTAIIERRISNALRVSNARTIAGQQTVVWVIHIIRNEVVVPCALTVCVRSSTVYGIALQVGQSCSVGILQSLAQAVASFTGRISCRAASGQSIS